MPPRCVLIKQDVSLIRSAGRRARSRRWARHQLPELGAPLPSHRCGCRYRRSPLLPYPMQQQTPPDTGVVRRGADNRPFVRRLTRASSIVPRIGLGIIFLWFGALKLVSGMSPAEDLAGRTLTSLTFHL